MGHRSHAAPYCEARACWTWPSHESDIDGPRAYHLMRRPPEASCGRGCDEKEAVDKRQREAIAASGLAYMGNPVLKAGERRQIPIAHAPGRAVIKPPAGFYKNGAVCSEQLQELRLRKHEVIRRGSHSSCVSPARCLPKEAAII